MKNTGHHAPTGYRTLSRSATRSRPSCSFTWTTARYQTLSLLAFTPSTQKSQHNIGAEIFFFLNFTFSVYPHINFKDFIEHLRYLWESIHEFMEADFVVVDLQMYLRLCQYRHKCLTGPYRTHRNPVEYRDMLYGRR